MSIKTGAAQYSWGDVFAGDHVPEKTLTFEFDLTGYTIEIQFRDSHGGTTIHTASVGSGITINGMVVTISPWIAPTVGAATTYIYDIEFTPPGGDKRTWLFGDITVHPDVTRQS